jgi:hypothetical protein
VDILCGYSGRKVRRYARRKKRPRSIAQAGSFCFALAKGSSWEAPGFWGFRGLAVASATPSRFQRCQRFIEQISAQFSRRTVTRHLGGSDFQPRWRHAPLIFGSRSMAAESSRRLGSPHADSRSRSLGLPWTALDQCSALGTRCLIIVNPLTPYVKQNKQSSVEPLRSSPARLPRPNTRLFSVSVAQSRKRELPCQEEVSTACFRGNSAFLVRS